MIKSSNNIEKKRFSLRPQPTKTARSTIISNENIDPSPSLKPAPPKAKVPKKLPPIRSKTLADDKSLYNEDLPGNGLAPPCPEEAKDTEPDELPVKKGKVERVKLPIYPNITNMAEFRKKHKLAPNQKVYIVTNGYGDIKRALDKRGWVQNQESTSRCFDLRWTIKSKDEDTQNLEDGQIVNHFEKNASITTKVGLCRNLRNLVWFCPVDINTFYPRCFDLSDEKDYEDFIEDFKFSKAESVLKLYVKLCEAKEFSSAKEIEETVIVALQVSEKRLLDPDDMLETYGEYQPVKITEEEWKTLSKDEISQESLIKKKFEARIAKLDNAGKPKKVTGKKKPKRKIIDAKATQSNKEATSKGRISPASQSDENNENQQCITEQDDEKEIEKESDLLIKIREILKKLKAKDPQYELNGDKNIWMMKPAGLSRGRGITCVCSLAEVLDIARKNANHWVVQKYIENPLIIHKRKFDIRQWVLVTDWNPLTVWFYEECYVRFSGGEYTTDDLDNRFVHLTNNSVTKHLKGEEDDSPFEQNMWRMETFQEHLKQLYPGRDVFTEIIKPKMKQAVIWALESAQDMIGNRKNSFEFYGYDFMVDEDFNVWLIEINLSPAMDYSTPVTKRLVKMVSEDVVKVVIDNNMGKKPKKGKKGEMSTGLFTCIHRSKRCVDKPMNSYGLELIVEGTAVEKSEK